MTKIDWYVLNEICMKKCAKVVSEYSKWCKNLSLDFFCRLMFFSRLTFDFLARKIAVNLVAKYSHRRVNFAIISRNRQLTCASFFGDGRGKISSNMDQQGQCHLLLESYRRTSILYILVYIWFVAVIINSFMRRIYLSGIECAIDNISFSLSDWLVPAALNTVYLGGAEPSSIDLQYNQ